MIRASIVLGALCLAACQATSAERMASAPPETYWVEYYQISER